MICPRRQEDPGGVFKLPGADTWREDGTCSYCGSINPELFLLRAREGEKLGPTDKTYKVYVGERDKFYFQHLSVDQMKIFVEMMNAKVMNIDYPGHFYVLPFFCGRGPEERQG